MQITVLAPTNAAIQAAQQQRPELAAWFNIASTCGAALASYHGAVCPCDTSCHMKAFDA
jgi:hypothetical protein